MSGPEIKLSNEKLWDRRGKFSLPKKERHERDVWKRTQRILSSCPYSLDDSLSAGKIFTIIVRKCKAPFIFSPFSFSTYSSSTCPAACSAFYLCTNTTSLTFSRSTITTIFSNGFLYLARSLPLFTSFALYHQNHGSLWLKLASYYQDVSFVEVYVKQTLQKEKWAEQVLLFIFTQFFFFGFSYMYINIYTEYIEYTVYIQYRRIIYTKQDWFCQSRNNFCRNYKTGSAGVAAAK